MTPFGPSCWPTRSVSCAAICWASRERRSEDDKEPSLKRPRGRPRSAAAEAAILSAAAELFADRGFQGFSLDEVARRAKVSRTTIYRRWPSKQALLMTALGGLRDGYDAVELDWSTVDAEGLAQVLLEAVPERLARPGFGRLASRLLGAALAHPELVEAFIAGYLEPRRSAFAAAVERMKAKGDLPAQTDPDVFQDILAGALTHRMLTSQGAFSADEWRSYCRALLSALGLKASALS